MGRIRLTEVADPATPPAGQVEIYATSAFPTNTLALIDDAGVRHKVGPPGVSRIVAAVAIANTETVVTSVQLPANWMAAGATFLIKAYGRLTSGATGGASSFRVRIGPTTLTGNMPVGFGITNSNSVTNAQFLVEALVTVRTAGAGGTVIGGMIVMTHTAPAAIAFTVKDYIGVTVSAVAVDTTVAQRVELTYISGNAGTTATFEVANIALMNNL